MSDPVAIYGAITGTAALMINAINGFNALYDRPWVRLRVRAETGKPGRSIYVTVQNVGRRKANVFPPMIQVIDRKHARVFSLTADAVWIDGGGWEPSGDESGSGLPELYELAEYEEETYSFKLRPEYTPVQAHVRNSLGRRTHVTFFLGRVRRVLFEIGRRWAQFRAQ